MYKRQYDASVPLGAFPSDLREDMDLYSGLVLVAPSTRTIRRLERDQPRCGYCYTRNEDLRDDLVCDVPDCGSQFEICTRCWPREHGDVCPHCMLDECRGQYTDTAGERRIVERPWAERQVELRRVARIDDGEGTTACRACASGSCRLEWHARIRERGVAATMEDHFVRFEGLLAELYGT